MPPKDKQAYLPSLQPDAPTEAERPVAVVAPLTMTDKLYSYTIPDALLDSLRPGQRVEVPLGRGNRTVVGFCIQLDRQAWRSTLKPIAKVLDDEPLLDEGLIELARWIARYYCCPTGRALSAMVPEPVRQKSGFERVRLLRLARPLETIEAEAKRIGPAQRKVLEYLEARDEPVEWAALKEALGCSDAPIKAAQKRAWLTVEEIRRPKQAPNFDQPPEEPSFRLNADQVGAIHAVRHAAEGGQFRVLLLHGVAGSGKTEVYVRSIREAVAAGKQAIMLVPEIALTTQLVDRLARRFQDLAVIHSNLTGVQRSLIWTAIASGQKRVIIGTRSAVFAPARDLGLIVVDEEQDSSYENLQAPRFHSRDVAIVRASQAKIPVVLGSATPSLETWYNAGRLKHYETVRLPNRVAGLPMPTVRVVEMGAERRDRKGFHLLSVPMEEQLRSALDRGEQAVLLLNRRGYSTVICRRCGWAAVCPRCDRHLVLHQLSNTLRCHRCSYREDVPNTCPDSGCRGVPIRFGMGTERVEEELQRKFPQARVARADSDTMLRGEQYEQLIRRFEQAELDVIVGTQMIAKGLDFPLVSFVGVINADTTMMVSDFRAGERTFQLITQVAGRAGRAKGHGTVIVQTETPDLPPIRFAVRHDYTSFAEQELAVRGKMRLPPVWRMTRIVLSDAADSKVRSEGARLAEAIRAAAVRTGAKVICDGPERCPVQRERNLYRYDVLLRSRGPEAMQRVLDEIRGKTLQKLRAKRVVVDVDPMSLT